MGPNDFKTRTDGLIQKKKTNKWKKNFIIILFYLIKVCLLLEANFSGPYLPKTLPSCS